MSKVISYKVWSRTSLLRALKAPIITLSISRVLAFGFGLDGSAQHTSDFPESRIPTRTPFCRTMPQPQPETRHLLNSSRGTTSSVWVFDWGVAGLGLGFRDSDLGSLASLLANASAYCPCYACALNLSRRLTGADEAWLLKGSWDLVSGVIRKVTAVIITYSPN